MTINERVRQIRKGLGLTLDQFGQRIGLKKSALSHIETKRGNVTDQTIRSICREFHIREEWLRDGTGEMREPDAGEELETAVSRMLSGESSEFRRRLVGILTRLSSDQWKQFEGYVLDLAEAVRPAESPLPESVEERHSREARRVDETPEDLARKPWDEWTREEKIAEFVRQLDEEEATAGEKDGLLGGATA